MAKFLQSDQCCDQPKKGSQQKVHIPKDEGKGGSCLSTHIEIYRIYIRDFEQHSFILIIS